MIPRIQKDPRLQEFGLTGYDSVSQLIVFLIICIFVKTSIVFWILFYIEVVNNHSKNSSIRSGMTPKVRTYSHSSQEQMVSCSKFSEGISWEISVIFLTMATPWHHPNLLAIALVICRLPWLPLVSMKDSKLSADTHRKCNFKKNSDTNQNWRT